MTDPPDASHQIPGQAGDASPLTTRNSEAVVNHSQHGWVWSVGVGNFPTNRTDGSIRAITAPPTHSHHPQQHRAADLAILLGGVEVAINLGRLHEVPQIVQGWENDEDCWDPNFMVR